MSATRPSVAAAVASAVRTVLVESGRGDREVTGAMLLGSDLGLDSLDLAQTVVLLERDLGIDPFRQALAGGPVRSVADLIAIYTTALETRSRQGA